MSGARFSVGSAFGWPNAKTPETEVSGVFKAMNSQVARTMHRPVQPSNEAPSFLESRTFQLGRRCVSGLPPIRAPSSAPSDGVFEFPRILHLQAWPTVRIRVAPNPRPSSPPSDGVFKFPRILHLPAWMTASIRVAPNPRSALRASRWSPRVSSNPASSCRAVHASPGRPESCIYGWVDDDSPT